MSKRNLYKPAPCQTPPRKTRHSLPQGRLVATEPRSLLSICSPKPEAGTSEAKTSPQTPRARRSLEYKSFLITQSDHHSPSLHHISPIVTRCPDRVKSSSSLSLSGTEVEQKRHRDKMTKPSLTQPSVLVVDASERHCSFKDNEVPIKTSYVKSPVKIVRHSPHKNSPHGQGKSGIPDNAQYAHAEKINVPVESVPSVNIPPSNISKNNESPSSTSPLASEGGSVSTVAGSPVDPRSKAIETVMVSEKNNPKSYVSFLDENDSITESEKEKKSLTDLYVRQPLFDETGISSIAEDSTQCSSVEKIKKKKRKPRVVQSKYMTSAMSRIGQKSSVAKRPDSRQNKAPSGTSKIKKTKVKTSLKALPKESEKELNEDRKTERAHVIFTSTPAEVPLADISRMSENKPVITPATNRRGHYEEVTLMTPASFRPNEVQSKDGKIEQSVQARQSRQTTSEISQPPFDLYYARLCQWRFVRSKFKRTFQKQERDAQEQIYGVWRLNEQLRERNRELKIELARQRKLEEIDRQLELQESCLKAVDENWNKLISSYPGLYESVDTTRHHILVKDIILPENEVHLLNALESCEKTLTEITSLVENDETKILLFSEEMKILADTVLEERKEHDRCTELLAAVSTLTTKERSLQAELIQRKEP